jgi:hypothetical protein
MRMNLFQPGLALPLAALLATTVNVCIAAEPVIDFSGLLETEYTSSNTNGSGSTTTGVSTAEFRMNARAGRFDIDAVLLAEDIGLVDAADYYPNSGDAFRPDGMHLESITVGTRFGDLGIRLGQGVLPFGDFTSAIVNDPATMQIGETKTRMGLLVSGGNGDTMRWNAGVFNGTHRSNAASETGAVISLAMTPDDTTTLGAGYISLQGAAKDAPALGDVYASKRLGKTTLSAEYVFTVAESGGNKPAALSLDLGYTLDPATMLGLRYETAQQGGLLGGSGDYRAYGIGATRKLKDNVVLNLEHLDASEGSISYHHSRVMVAVEF